MKSFERNQKATRHVCLACKKGKYVGGIYYIGNQNHEEFGTKLEALGVRAADATGLLSASCGGMRRGYKSPELSHQSVTILVGMSFAEEPCGSNSMDTLLSRVSLRTEIKFLTRDQILD
jgi:hypothetical protein